MSLTDTKIKQAKPREKVYKVSDERGLYLEVTPAGSKWWRFKYRIDGKEKRLSLGVYPDVGLQKAREKRDDARKLVADGVDPSVHRKAQKQAKADANASSFEVVTREWLEKQKKVWADSHAEKVIRRFERDVFPWLGKRPIGEIKPFELLKVLQRIEARVVETAHRAKQNCGQVFRYAVATGRAERDITVDLKGALTPWREEHFASITNPEEIGPLLCDMYAYKKQFYMLGPNIDNIPDSFKERFKAVFVKTDFNTVVSEIHQFDVDDDTAHAIQLCSELDEPTLVYVRSPGRAHDVAIQLTRAVRNAATDSAMAAADWVRQSYHADWSFGKALDAGIGVHHGRLPRSLTQMVVRRFNEGALRYLVCTSTLIEGVNTRAKNVVVLDNKVAARKFDYFTFSNIRGRSGRMFKHFIGHVYLYHEPPQPELPLIDIPIVTQSEGASDALLIQLEPYELTKSSSERVSRYYNDPLLSLDVLRENAGIDPSAQLNLAQAIVSNIETAHAMLAWRGYPSYEEFKWTCELLWEHLTDHRRRSGVSSGKQLAYLLMKMLKAKKFSDGVAMFHRDGRHVDEAIEDLLDFQRQWAEFRAPNLLSALGRIQKHVFERYGYAPGNYDAYVTQLENLGRSPVVNALDEYGLPTQIGQVVWESMGRPDTLDDTLATLRERDFYYTGLSPFENRMVREICATLRPPAD